MTPDSYLHVLAAESYRPFACRARSRVQLEAWQRSFRSHLRSLLGLDKITERGLCDLFSHQIGQEELDDHVREEWSIQSEPGFELTFYLLRPRNGQSPFPVVLTPHGHIHTGRRAYVGLWESNEERREILSAEMDIALQAVREGYMAIAPDMRGFAALRRQEDRDSDALCSCRTMQMHALLLGRTLVGERVWDVMRLIDYAVTRDDVDSTRIVVIGNSGGGTVSLYAAACDERITAAVPSASFCTLEDSIGSIWHCECNYVPGLLSAAEMADVAGLIAPRPFLAVTGRDDPIFPYSGVLEAFAALQRIYEVANAPERCRLYVGEGGHRHYQAAVWPFVREVLERS